MCALNADHRDRELCKVQAMEHAPAGAIVPSSTAWEVAQGLREEAGRSRTAVFLIDHGSAAVVRMT